MGLYEHYPYTNFHELNLNWILEELRRALEEIKIHQEQSLIHYADPIQWNITKQYTVNTVVIDPATGIAYISTTAVPDNIQITNTDYWSPIFDLSRFFTETDAAVAALQSAIDSVNSDLNTTNTNLEQTNTALAQTNTALAQTNTNLGQTNADVSALTERVDQLENVSIVNTFANVSAMLAADLASGIAVNTMGFYEPGDGGGGCYVISDTGTVNGMSVFRMNNGKYAALQIPVNAAVNIKQLGAKADGTADISSIVNAFTGNYPLLVPVGIFAVNNPLVLKNSLIGITSGRFSATGVKGSVLRSGLNSGGTIDISGTVGGITIKDIEIVCTSDADAIYFHPDSYDHAKIENVTIRNFTRRAINISPTVSMSRAVYIDQCSLIAEPWTPSIGVYLNNKTADCRISDTEIMGVQEGIESNSSSLILSNVHIWNSNSGTAANKNDWWMLTYGIIMNTTKLLATNLYIDCPRFPFYLQDAKSTISVNNFFLWADATIDTGIDSTIYDGTLIRLTAASNEVYEFNGGIIFCDDHHTNMFNTGTSRQIKLNNVKIIARTAEMCYLDPTTMYMLPSALQINNGEVMIPNYGSNYMAIAEYYSDWACCDTLILTGPDSKCVELKLMANSITKTVIGADIAVYYMRFQKQNRYITRIVIPSGAGYFIKYKNASLNACTRLFANFTYNNAPMVPVTYSDTSNLTQV